MSVTVFGMVTLVMPLHIKKAPDPTLVTEYVFWLYVTLAGIVKAPVRLG